MENTQVRAKHFHGMHNFPLDLACTAPGLKDSGVYMDPTLDVARKKRHLRFFISFTHKDSKSHHFFYTFSSMPNIQKESNFGPIILGFS